MRPQFDHNLCIDDVIIMQIVIHHNYTSDSFVSNKGSIVFEQLCTDNKRLIRKLITLTKRKGNYWVIFEPGSLPSVFSVVCLDDFLFFPGVSFFHEKIRREGTGKGRRE